MTKKEEKKDAVEAVEPTVIPQDEKSIESGIVRPAKPAKQTVVPLGPTVEANPTHIDAKEVPKEETISDKERTARIASHEGQKYYDRYPKIRGEICEFCGIHYSKCPHYADFHKKMGNFICACGHSKDPMAAKQLQLMYVPHRGYFLCDSAGCAQIYKDRFGGFERLVSYHFFVSEIPYEGSVLPDPSDPMIRATSLNR